MTEQRHHQRADRRETMLEELIVAMRRHHRRRRRLRATAAWGLLLAVAGGTWIVRAQQVAQPPPLADSGHDLRQPEHPAPKVVNVSGDYRTGLVKVIDDDELVLRLAEIDRPAGLIRTEGRVWLTSAVADAEIETDGEPEPPL
ncbi:MAG: hypothetical protein ACYS15_08975 [Planctomycetota bacterium]|jgi:hypothetical protein